MYRRELVGRVFMASKSLRSRCPDEEGHLETNIQRADEAHDEPSRLAIQRRLLIWRGAGEENLDIIGASGLLTVRRHEWTKPDFSYKVICDRLFDMTLEKTNALLPEEVEHYLAQRQVIERVSFFKRTGKTIPDVFTRKYWILHSCGEYEIPTREKCPMEDVSGITALFLSEMKRSELM